MRACWTGKPQAPDPSERRVVAVVGHGRVPGDATGRRLTTGAVAGTAAMTALGGSPRGRQPRTFVPVDELFGSAELDASEASVTVAPAPVNGIPGTWWLWGDPEPWPEG